MAGFRNFAELGQAAESRLHLATWRKSPGYTPSQAVWYDLSMTPGNPTPNYYASAPLVSAALARSTDGGINHGPNAPSGMGKYLLRSTLITASSVAARHILCDYLLYYPFIDQGETAEQFTTNTVSIPRYPTGKGVQILPVIVAPASNYTIFTVKYTNQDGVSGRVTPSVRGNIGSVNSYILGSFGSVNLPQFAGPFMPLQAGDTGVRSIESVTFTTNDVGLVCFVLVKPLGETMFIDSTAPVERTYGLDFPTFPKIEDDAYLNHIMYSGGAMASAIHHGIIETITN